MVGQNCLPVLRYSFRRKPAMTYDQPYRETGSTSEDRITQWSLNAERYTIDSLLLARMSGGFAGLPSHPLTDTDIQALDHHTAIEFCFPVYRHAADTDAIVVVALGTDDRAHFLYYNPDDQQWEQLDVTDRPESITDDIPLDADMIDTRLTAHYDEDDLKPTYPNQNDPLLGAVQGLPDEPLTDAQLKQIESKHPMIGTVMPLVELQSDGVTIAAFLFFDNYIEQQRIIAGVGYDPDDGYWQLFGSVEGSDVDRTEALEQLTITYAEWVDTRYALDDITVIENPEEALAS
jgi:hypothetical protein